MSKKKIIKEDQRYLSGVDSYVDWMKRTNPVQMSLSDILSMNRKDGDNPSPTYPHNIQNIEELLAKAIEDTRTIRTRLEEAKENLIIKNDKLKSHVIRKMLKSNENILKEYDKLMKDIPYVVLDK